MAPGSALEGPARGRARVPACWWGVCGVIGRLAGASGGRTGREPGETAQGSAAPGGGTRCTPPPGASFGPGGDVSLASFSCVLQSLSGQDQGKVRSFKIIALMRRNFVSTGDGEDGLSEGFGKPGNVCAFAKFAKQFVALNSGMVRHF